MSMIGIVGSLNVDISFRVGTMPVPGETVLATDRSRAFGGKGGNQAIAAAYLGGDIGFVGAVGQDEAGRRYRDHLSGHGVDVDGVAVMADTDTGTATIVVDDLGENLIIVDPGANAALDPLWVRHHVERLSPTLVMAQLEVPLTALDAMADALPAETTFILNPAPMPPEPKALTHLLARADVLVPNRKELGQLAGASEPRTLAQVKECVAALHFEGAVVVTLGGDGALVQEEGGEMVHHAALLVDPIDTTGAGDAFCGALAVGLANGWTLPVAVRQAIAVAGLSTTKRGAQFTRELADAVPGRAGEAAPIALRSSRQP